MGTFAKITNPSMKITMKNIRLMGITKSIFPLSILSYPAEVGAHMMTGSHISSTCSVEPSLIRTFDNMTVDYTINDCEHVLLLDGSRKIPLSVTTRTVSNSHKAVKILSGITEIHMIPTKTGFTRVMVNSEELIIPTVAEQKIQMNHEGKTLAILERFKDDVVSVYIPEQGLRVLSNGSIIEVVASQLLKSRTVGLCGDMNGERTWDLKTPRMCVLRPRLAALSFMLNKSGAKAGFERCSGIPATLKEEFVRETTKCPREVIIPTPVSRLYEHISLLYPHNIVHYPHNIAH